MVYITTFTKNWADEFYVYFFDYINEDYYNKYKYCQEKIKSLKASFYFGTNEGWDDFEYLDKTFQEASEEEIQVIDKFNIKAEIFFDSFQYTLDDYLREQDVDIEEYDDIWELPFEEFKNIIDKACE